MKKNWVTTVVGILVMLGIALNYLGVIGVEEINNTEKLIGLLVGAGLMASKDGIRIPRFGVGGQNPPDQDEEIIP